MIIIAQEPEPITLTGNPVTYTIRAVDGDGNTVQWLGARSELIFDGYFDLPIDSISLNWIEPGGLGTAIDYFSSDDLTDPRAFPRFESAFPSTLAYYEAVAARMEAHPLAGPYFRIYAVDNGDGISLWAVARRYEEGWDVQWGNNNILSGSTDVQSSTELISTAPEDYRIHLDAYIEQDFGSSNYKEAGKLSSPVDEQGLARFDISSLLNAAAFSTFPLDIQGPNIPAWGLEEVLLHDVLRKYFVRLYERNSEGDNDFQFYFPRSPQLALVGGIAQNFFALYNIFENFSESNAFLTWKPDKRTLGPDQPEWLAWYNYTDSVAEIVLFVIEYDEEGSETSKYMYDLGPNRLKAEPSQVLLIPVGPQALALEDETIKYEVRVVDALSNWEGAGGDFFSQPRTYYIDRRHYHTVRYLMYLNGWNCPETLRCVGDMDVEMTSSALESRRVLPPGFGDRYSELMAYRTEWADRFTYRSGYMTAAEAETLREILIYRKLYEVYEDGYIPLHIPGEASFQITSSRQNLHSITIQAEPALEPRYFSNFNIEVAEGDYWLNNDETSWARLFGQPWQLP
jgi:hypothetical protein